MPALKDCIASDPMILRMRMPMTDEEFLEFCRLNDSWQIERSAEGEIHLMPPSGMESGYRETEVVFQLKRWANKDGSGVVFGSTSGFVLPSGQILAPDAAWVVRARMKGVSRGPSAFIPLAPDFVVEVRSQSDRLERLKDKMSTYIANGTQLGWLIDAPNRQVIIYQSGQQPHTLEHPEKLSGDPVLKGFELDLREIWEVPF